MSSYFTYANLPTGPVSPADVDARFQAVSAGFDLMPPPNALQENRWYFSVAGGTGDALTAVVTPVPTAYAEGMGIRVKIASNNSGVASIDVGGLGATDIVRADGAPLQADDLVAGEIVDLVFDGSDFRMVTTVAHSASPPEILADLLAVDGEGSGLDADLLRGMAPTSYGLSLLDDADAEEAKETIGLAGIATDGVKLGIGTDTPSFALELGVAASISDRTIGIDGVPALFIADQDSFAGSVAVGDGLRTLSHATEIEGQFNTAVGIGALVGTTNQWANTGIGYGACGYFAEGTHPEGGGVFGNTAVGYLSMAVMVNAFDNTALGALALLNLRNGDDNVAVGIKALTNFREGCDNTALGYGTLENLSGGDGNVGIGAQAGRFLADGLTPLGEAGSCIYIGDRAFAGPSDEPTNEIVIGSLATGQGSNTIVLGNESVTDTYLRGVVHLTDGLMAPAHGTTPSAPNASLDSATGELSRSTFVFGALAARDTVDDTFWDGSDLAVLNGGTGASDAAGARVNLGLEIGTQVQAFDPDLSAIAALSTTAYGRGQLELANASALRTYAGLGSAALLTAGAAGGAATLDGTGKVPTSQLPALALSDVFVVASESAMLALTVEEGDIAIRTDLNRTFVHNGGTPNTLAAWSALLAPTDAVTSVNGESGAVTLTASDIGSAPAGDMSATDVQSALAELASEKLSASAYTPGDLLAKLLTVDGTGSGIDADLLRGASPAALGLTLLSAASAGDARTALGVVIGTNVQAYDGVLAAIAGLTSAANKLPYFTGPGTAGTADLTAFGRSLIDDADAAGARVTLGLGTMATQAAGSYAALSGASFTGNVTTNGYVGTQTLADTSLVTRLFLAAGGDSAYYSSGSHLFCNLGGSSVYGSLGPSGLALATDLAVTEGGTGASSAAGARANLGLGTMATQAAGSYAALSGASFTGNVTANGYVGTQTIADTSPVTRLFFTAGGDSAYYSAGSHLFCNLGGSSVYGSLGPSGLSLANDLAVSEGGTGASTASGARANLGLVIGTDVAPIASPGLTGTPTTGGIEIGYRDTPRVTGGLERGKVLATASGFTAAAGPAAGSTYHVYNDSASPITITQGVGLTLRLSGTTTTGNRTLAPRGFATLWYNATGEAVCHGTGLS